MFGSELLTQYWGIQLRRSCAPGHSLGANGRCLDPILCTRSLRRSERQVLGADPVHQVTPWE